MAMQRSLLDALLDGPFELASRPEPVPGDLRLAWGIALVILILGRSRGKRASLQKLHFMAHSTRTRQARAESMSVFEGKVAPATFVVRVEPWLNRALAFARASGLVTIERGSHAQLTDQGISALDEISQVDSVLSEERAFLDAFGLRATEAAIQKIMRMERLL
jgi:hypothetical protein